MVIRKFRHESSFKAGLKGRASPAIRVGIDS